MMDIPNEYVLLKVSFERLFPNGDCPAFVSHVLFPGRPSLIHLAVSLNALPGSLPGREYAYKRYGCALREPVGETLSFCLASEWSSCCVFR